MMVMINGKLVPEEQAVVSVFDRGFLYGDGLFETMLVHNGRVFRWDQHLERLRQGADFIGLRVPYADGELRGFAHELITRNALPECVLRLTLTRGVGIRGYSPKGADRPTLVMSVHATSSLHADDSPGWRAVTASPRLPANEPLAKFKTCNKLAQILARAEADAAGADEAVLLNTEGFVVEGASSNLFWVEREMVCTPPLGAGILRGITRGVTLELCESLGIETSEAKATSCELREKQAVFFSLSSWGIVAAEFLDGHPLRQSGVTRQLQVAYAELVTRETESGPGNFRGKNTA